MGYDRDGVYREKEWAKNIPKLLIKLAKIIGIGYLTLYILDYVATLNESLVFFSPDILPIRLMSVIFIYVVAVAAINGVNDK